MPAATLITPLNEAQRACVDLLEQTLALLREHGDTSKVFNAEWHVLNEPLERKYP